jgi:hypothetical protein
LEEIITSLHLKYRAFWELQNITTQKTVLFLSSPFCVIIVKQICTLTLHLNFDEHYTTICYNIIAIREIVYFKHWKDHCGCDIFLLIGIRGALSSIAG